MITYEQRENAYSNATAIQKHLYAGHGAGLTIEAVASKNQVQNKIEFAIAIGDVILGLVPQEKLPELLIERLGIDQAAALRVTADVLDILAPLDEPSAAASIPINTITDDDSLASEIAEAEAAIQTMQPIRTMSHDMETMRSALEDEPVHTAASQADLLDRTTATKDEAPNDRWNTAQT